MIQKKPHYAKYQSAWLAPILGRKAGALAIHWLFQGLLYMDPTERGFKLGLDLALALLASAFLALWLPVRWAIGLGAFLAHTANFIFNGQVYGVLKHWGGVRHSAEAFDREVQGLADRIAREPSIAYAAAYGSLARGEWSPTSDLDVRLVRLPGWTNGLRASWFAMTERTRAFGKGFPLDLFVCDSYASLEKMAERKTPVVLAGLDTDVQL